MSCWKIRKHILVHASSSGWTFICQHFRHLEDLSYGGSALCRWGEWIQSLSCYGMMAAGWAIYGEMSTIPDGWLVVLWCSHVIYNSLTTTRRYVQIYIYISSETSYQTSQVSVLDFTHGPIPKNYATRMLWFIIKFPIKFQPCYMGHPGWYQLGRIRRWCPLIIFHIAKEV